MNGRHYTYLGFEYRTWDEVEEDNIKTFHECWKDGKEVKMPHAFYNHSPYSLITIEEFKGFVDNIALVEFLRG
jgi:hypothetical protein